MATIDKSIKVIVEKLYSKTLPVWAVNRTVKILKLFDSGI
jgi:hypothetical protein